LSGKGLEDATRASAAVARFVSEPEAFRHASASALEAQAAADARVARHHHQRSRRWRPRSIKRLRRLHRHVGIGTAGVGSKPTYESSRRPGMCAVPVPTRSTMRWAVWRTRLGRRPWMTRGWHGWRHVLRRQALVGRYIARILVVGRYIRHAPSLRLGIHRRRSRRSRWPRRCC
jgi:hypothetical protein